METSITQFRGLNALAEPGDVAPWWSSEQNNCYSARLGELTTRQGLGQVVHDDTTESDNDIPVLSAIGAQATTAGVTLNFTAAATDGDTVRYRLGRAPANASIDITGGTFTWVPASTQVGVHYVDVIAADDQEPPAWDYETVTITVSS